MKYCEISDHMLSLKTEMDLLHEARALVRYHRINRALRQDDLAARSGLGVATLRRFERTGQIGFSGLAKILVSLGLADDFLSTLKPSSSAPKDIGEFLEAGKTPQRIRAPRRATA